MPSARHDMARRVSRLPLLFASGICLVVQLQPASAVDWTLNYSLGDTLSGSDNIRQIVDPEGPAGSTRSSAGLDLIMNVKSLTWGFSGNAGYTRYFGDDIPDPSNSQSRAIRSDLEKKTRDTDYTLSAFYSVAPATTTEFTDLDIIETDIERLSYGVTGGFVHRINKRDSLDFSIGNTWSDYSDTSPTDSVTPNRSLNASLRWVRQFNARVSGNMLTSIVWYEADDSECGTDIPFCSNRSGTENLVYKNTVGTEAQLTRRLTITANAGAAVIDNYQFNEQFPSLPRERTMVYGFIGDFGLEYKPFNDTTFNIFLSQDVSIDDLGDLRASQSARFSLSYTINDFSGLALSGGLSKSTGGENDLNPPREVWNASAVYSHTINSRWNASIGYRWVQSEDFDDQGQGFDFATSNTVFVSLTTNGTLMP